MVVLIVLPCGGPRQGAGPLFPTFFRYIRPGPAPLPLPLCPLPPPAAPARVADIRPRRPARSPAASTCRARRSARAALPGATTWQRSAATGRRRRRCAARGQLAAAGAPQARMPAGPGRGRRACRPGGAQGGALRTALPAAPALLPVAAAVGADAGRHPAHRHRPGQGGERPLGWAGQRWAAPAWVQAWVRFALRMGARASWRPRPLAPQLPPPGAVGRRLQQPGAEPGTPPPPRPAACRAAPWAA